MKGNEKPTDPRVHGADRIRTPGRRARVKYLSESGIPAGTAGMPAVFPPRCFRRLRLSEAQTRFLLPPSLPPPPPPPQSVVVIISFSAHPSSDIVDSGEGEGRGVKREAGKEGGKKGGRGGEGGEGGAGEGLPARAHRRHRRRRRRQRCAAAGRRPTPPAAVCVCERSGSVREVCVLALLVGVGMGGWAGGRVGG